MKSLHQQNMKYKLVIFDFDGTIADTSPGILDSHRFALETMKHDIPSEKALREAIGGNLLQTYIMKFGFEEEKAREAVKIYRNRYSQVGIHMAVLYPGFESMLQKLKESGVMIGVATLKADRFAKVMLEELGISQYFDAVCGMDEYDKMTKSDLIKKCCGDCKISEADTVLIGDSNNDLHGAVEAGVEFVAVTYGFGFRKDEQYNFLSADSTAEVYQIICGENRQ